jgi:hypothetical protein
MQLQVATARVKTAPVCLVPPVSYLRGADETWHKEGLQL